MTVVKTRVTDCYDGYDLDIIHIGEVFNYTIPTFNVKVQHAVTIVFEIKRKTVQYDIFLIIPQSDCCCVPCSIRVRVLLRPSKSHEEVIIKSL